MTQTNAQPQRTDKACYPGTEEESSELPQLLIALLVGGTFAIGNMVDAGWQALKGLFSKATPV